MIQLEDHDVAVIVEAHVQKYGDTAEETATQRAKALRELGDTIGAQIWSQVAAVVARQYEAEPAT